LTGHLGSTNLAITTAGAVVSGSTSRYHPFGGFRTTPNQTITDRGFTGHAHNNLGANDLGLVYMGARFYLPGVGRFLSADVLVPDPTNPQQFNRYSYVLNNALRFTDPTGHYCYDPSSGADLLGTCINDDGTTYSLFPPTAQQAIDQYCTAPGSLACSGPGIGYITIDLYFLKNLAGYDPGVVRLPYHINPNYGLPNSLFPWEGVANVTYAEHSALHPAYYLPESEAWKHFAGHWLGEATGIIQTMINRATDGNYQSPNHAALTRGQYAAPGRNLNDSQGVYQEFYGLAFMVIQLEVRVDQPYKSFAHQDLLPLRGKGSHLNDRCCTDTAAFGPWDQPKNWYIPKTYPHAFR
jgi:RHS repeat-associated protein